MTQNVQLDKAAPAAAPQARNAAPQVRTGFLGNLPVGLKLALAGLLLGIPLVGALGALVNEANNQTRHLESQLTGQQLLPNLGTAMQNTQLVRLSSVRLLQGDQTAQADNEKQRQTLTKALKDLQAAAKQAGYTEVVTSAGKALQAFETLNWSVDQGSMQPTEAQAAYTDLLKNSIQPMFNQISDATGMKTATDNVLGELATFATTTVPNNMATAGAILSGTIPIVQRLGGKGGAIDAASRQQARQQWDTSNEALNNITGGIERLNKISPKLKAQFTSTLNDLRSSSGDIFNAIDDNLLTPARVGMNASDLSALTPPYAKSLFGAQVNSIDAYGSLLTDAVNQQKRNANLLILATILLTVLLAALLYVISRSITEPLSRLTDASQRLSRGDLDVNVPVTTRDELGTLSNSFNTAAEQLRENAHRVELERIEAQRLQHNVGEFLDVTMDIADGDLTKRGKVTEDVLGNVVDSINLMVDELADTLKGVQNASQSVTGGSRTMLATTEQIEQGATTTAQETQRVAQQAQQINAQIQEMARIAQASADTARQALLASQQGQEAVTGTLEGMNSIRQATQSVAERVQSLQQRSEQIQDILDSISHIASQTNLLSLHASIEAAGAGEAGNRFTVVAEEVRQLADESAAATSRITTLVQGIQTEIREVAESMRQSAAQVEQGYQVAGQAGQQLEQIGKLSEESALLAQQISQAATEQVHGVESVGQGVQQIAQIAEASQQSVQQGRNAAEQLQQLAQQLNQTLTRFRLPS